MERLNNFLVVAVVLLAIVMLIFARESKADCDEIFLKVGAGYKFNETERLTNLDTGGDFEIAFRDPISARIETGIECGNLTYGISHHSQWRTGFPFNNEHEMHKTEFFIDYKFSWGI